MVVYTYPATDLNPVLEFIERWRDDPNHGTVAGLGEVDMTDTGIQFCSDEYLHEFALPEDLRLAILAPYHECSPEYYQLFNVQALILAYSRLRKLNALLED